MMRADSLNLHIDPVRTEMNSDESKSKEFLADKNILQISSTDEG